mmetsp:Transcript_8601/g.18566  ORF Transcript_8601/g.18566 Transcript_8601/m.18566 type:complete len:201 (-) Transcript_8601:362-964(-)
MSATIFSVSRRRHRSPPSGPRRVAPLFLPLSVAVPSPPLPPLATMRVGFSYETVPSSTRSYCSSFSPVVVLLVASSPSSVSLSTSNWTTVPGATRTSQSSPPLPLSYILPPVLPSSARKLRRRSRATKLFSWTFIPAPCLSPIRLLDAAAPPPPNALGLNVRLLSPARVLRLWSSLRTTLPPRPPLPPSGMPLAPFFAFL